MGGVEIYDSNRNQVGYAGYVDSEGYYNVNWFANRGLLCQGLADMMMVYAIRGWYEVRTHAGDSPPVHVMPRMKPLTLILPWRKGDLLQAGSWTPQGNSHRGCGLWFYSSYGNDGEFGIQFRGVLYGKGLDTGDYYVNALGYGDTLAVVWGCSPPSRCLLPRSTSEAPHEIQY